MEATLRPGYNCAHFLCDAWLEETGCDISPVLACFLAPVARRTAHHGLTRGLRRLPAPVGPCVVLWRRGGAAPHVGLYVRGRVLHLTNNGPVRQLLAVAKVGYDSVRYYAPR